MLINKDKTVIIPNNVLKKLKITHLTHNEMELLRYESKVDIAIEHFFNKISIEKLAKKYSFREDEILFIVNAYEEFVLKYIQEKRNMLHLENIDLKFPIEIKLKVLIECLDNKMSIRETSDKFGIHISSIYKWINVVKKSRSMAEIHKIDSAPPSAGKNDKINSTEKESEIIKGILNNESRARNSIVKEYLESKLTMEEIAKKYSVNKHNIFIWKKRYFKELKIINKIEVATDYLNGNASAKDLAKKHKTSLQNIYFWSKKYKEYIPSKINNFTDKKTVEENMTKYNDKLKIIIAKEHIEDGISIKDLAKKYNTNPTNIYNWRKKYANGIKENAYNIQIIEDKKKIENTLDLKELENKQNERLRIENEILKELLQKAYTK